MSAQSANLGFPRIGAQRELKKAVEAFWANKINQEELLTTAAGIRKTHWDIQSKAGLDIVPSNDFSLYDQVLDTILTLGAVPKLYKSLLPQDTTNADDASLLSAYFAMARGFQQGDIDVTAMEMTKWFDTNYHFIVPEFDEDSLSSVGVLSQKIFTEYQEAKALGIETRPVLIGPVTFVLIGKLKSSNLTQESVLRTLLPVYAQVIQKLIDLGVKSLQIDEPVLAAFDLTPEQLALYDIAYNQTLAPVYNGKLSVILTTYFDALRNHNEVVANLPVDGVHIDLLRTVGKANTISNDSVKDIEALCEVIKPTNKIISLGLVDARNVWKNDLRKSIALAQKAVDALGGDKSRIIIAGSASLLHSPVDLANETKLSPTFKSWLAFAVQKLDEIVAITRGLNQGLDAIADVLAVSDKIVEERSTSDIIHNQQVQQRLKDVTPEMLQRKSLFSVREGVQKKAVNLPLFPTTSIGSFPQTPAIRTTRAHFKQGKISEEEYTKVMQEEIQRVVQYQHDIDIDVLVHGEPERNDMVEYFGEQLSGFFFTSNGWVQSYGSRCTKPPVIYGDISRPHPMTVKWSQYAQSLTDRPMKGMLTGPITILQWSFVRDDIPRHITAQQIALAIRDEVADLEKAGIKVIQIDEAALREGLPLRHADRAFYLEWAVNAFKLSSCCVEDATQIHTHMCYSEFNDIIDSVAKMDTDSISIETSRSQMELLEAFVNYNYPNHIGPGVYDIHSPRVPSKQEIYDLLSKALKVLKPTALWVNPDCGLKTRAWKEVEPALRAMVEAAKQLRLEYANTA